VAVGERPLEGTPARSLTLPRPAPWLLPLGLAAALAVLTTIPYVYAWTSQPPGRVFMGFFFLGDDANTYLAKMREGWEGSWIWTNRYSTEPGTGAYFFTWWIALGHLAALLHLDLMFTFHAVRVAGAFGLLAAAWLFIKEFVDDPRARRFAIWFLAVGLGMGYVIQAIGKPYLFGQQTDTLDWRMPELSAFYSVLALPHFAWAAAFQAAACVFTLRAGERGSLRWGLLAGLAWLGLASIHAQMPILLGGAFAAAFLYRRVSMRGYAAVALAFGLALPYVAYSYWGSSHVPEVVRWSLQWRNNLPPDGLSLFLALAPQVVLAALGVPGALRRRSRADVFLLAWLLLLALILWTPNPAGNLRRRFFDGVYLPLVVLAARGMYEQVVPRLRGRAVNLVPFAHVAFASVGCVYLLLAPMLFATNPSYSLSTDELGALRWLDANPRGTVLSMGHFGLYVPAYSSDSAYVGQYSETYLYFEKQREAYAVLTGQQDAAAFARDHDIGYLVWTADVGGGAPVGVGAPVYDTPNAKIYRRT
jgi:hypothetical protein